MTSAPRLVTTRELFDGNRRFRIPIYQRAYAWNTVEIETLIRDIASVLDRPSYYIGTLVLHEVPGVDSERRLYDVIDGQQRLTTLFIMLTHPALRQLLCQMNRRFEITDRLITFEERKRSNLDLGILARAGTSPESLSQMNDDGIKAGAAAVNTLLGDDSRLALLLRDQGSAAVPTRVPTSSEVLEYLLDHVQIVLTELPSDTDLNHYFEVMNTRGEQLEKHEIVKAHLLGLIGDNSRWRKLFATVWDACSDFTRHIQARFKTKDRSALFGDPDQGPERGWSTLLPKNIEELEGISLELDGFGGIGSRHDLDAVLADPLTQETPGMQPDLDDGDAGRYGTIIDFPNFLLHVLRLHAQDDGREVSLDDKKLVVQFQSVITSDIEAMRFAYRLLRTKFLFDNFIIKPLDEPGRSDDSNWVIHRLHCTRTARENRISPVNAFGELTRQVLMLQTMYQVTHQRRVYKEFLYQLLEYLDNSWASTRIIQPEGFVSHMHRMATDDLAALRLDAQKLDAGTAVPHFALNLLDYKLWYLSEVAGQPPEGLPAVNTGSFRFAYRTSIEHFLPVNLAQTETERAAVNRFGNLCLMSRSENSLRSDHTPDWKVTKYGTTNQSLKFYYMAALQRAQKAWGPAQIDQSGQAMRKVLNHPLQ